MSVAFLATLLADTTGDDPSSPPRAFGGRDETPRVEEVAADRALVRRLTQGDEAAFRDIVAEYFGRLSRFAYSLVGARDIADDIAQDVLARIWERRVTWHPEHSIEAYLYGAVRNAALNELRRTNVRNRKTAALTEAIEHDTQRPDVIDRLSIETMSRALRAEIDRLPERRRTALRLRYEEGLMYPTIAATLGISVKSAEQLVALTIQTLRKALRHLR